MNKDRISAKDQWQGIPIRWRLNWQMSGSDLNDSSLVAFDGTAFSPVGWWGMPARRW
ncbi:MAG TPA: hypothetical protein VLH15_11470 [Dehalococcoidales bacterium]|nr:hypothetical protein [Dehalococcoidales bacterium]